MDPLYEITKRLTSGKGGIYLASPFTGKPIDPGLEREFELEDDVARRQAGTPQIHIHIHNEGSEGKKK